MRLREIRNILDQYGIRPNKRLGQNFLVDKNIQKKIINAIDPDKTDTILEIGPGLGALTGELCGSAKRVIAIEKDRRLHEFLLKNNMCSNLELISGDILKHDFSGYSKIKIAGNLPYYILSPILVNLLNNRRCISSIFISVQKEFAQRIAAGPGNKAYGSISCFVKFYAEPRILFTIKKNAFYPVPRVDSCFLRLDIRNNGLYLTDEEKLFKIIMTCFEKRRKTILSSLASSGLLGDRRRTLERLEASGISSQRRPETLSLEEFTRLVI